MGKKLTQEEFIEKAREIHGDKYNYSKVNYINNKTKVCIICPIHGEFYQKPILHLQGSGCPKCTGKNKTTEEFIEEAKKIHGNKYDYSKVEYVNATTKIRIICPKHGEFLITPNNHLRGEGCKLCAYDFIRTQKLSDKNTWLNNVIKIHGNKYNYSKVEYVNNITKVCIICPEHGEFWQRAADHYYYGCPFCSHKISKPEKEIVDFCKSLTNNVIENDRTILNGKELDIYMPNINLAIEYNGLVWHSEKYGKDSNYHLDKLNECNKKGIRIIQIFEDEYLEHKDIVLSKIKHLLKKDGDVPKVQARKCVIKEINKKEAQLFLEKNHIQGYVPSTIYLGCYYNDELVGVMTFKEEKKNNNKWELNRFATDINKRCIGVGGKLFKYFINEYQPEYIKSFADRRWTLDKDNNLYTKLGFRLTETLRPDYRYFYQKKYGNQRIHKFNFRKQILLNKHQDVGLTEKMTEKEMCNKIGAYRVWDCGLFKFEWCKKN